MNVLLLTGVFSYKTEVGYQECISNRSFHPQRQKWTWEVSYLYCDFWCYLLWFCRMLIETSLKTVSLQFINRIGVIFVTFVCSWFSAVICITHKTNATRTEVAVLQNMCNVHLISSMIWWNWTEYSDTRCPSTEFCTIERE